MYTLVYILPLCTLVQRPAPTAPRMAPARRLKGAGTKKTSGKAAALSPPPEEARGDGETRSAREERADEGAAAPATHSSGAPSGSPPASGESVAGTQAQDAAAGSGEGQSQDAALDSVAHWARVLADVTELLATGRLPMDASVAQIKARFGAQMPDVNRSFFTRRYGDLRDAGRAIVLRAQALQVAGKVPSDADLGRVMGDEKVQAILRQHKLNDKDSKFVKNALAVDWPKPRVTKTGSAEHDAEATSKKPRVEVTAARADTASAAPLPTLASPAAVPVAVLDRMTQLEARVAAIEASFGTLGTRIDAAEKRSKEVANKVDRLLEVLDRAEGASP